jgi:hypothetical protein
MIPEWSCKEHYQFGDSVWHDDIQHYSVKTAQWNREPEFGSEFWTTDKNVIADLIRRGFMWGVCSNGNSI